MDTIRTLIKISRPHFWIYLLGPYILGYLLGSETPQAFLSRNFFFFIALFSLPMNLFLYGINDVHDQATDQHNPKKNSREHLLQASQRRVLMKSIIVSLFIFLIGLAFSQLSPVTKLLGLLFLFLGWSYSAPPFRWKGKPILDSTSNVLYLLPGLMGYAQLTNQLPPLLVMFALWAWTSAMHLFSAIPDIKADKQANILTTAVLYGKEYSLLLCGALWGIFSFGLLMIFPKPWILLTLIYPAIPILLLWKPLLSIEKVYWLFPKINFVLGGLTFGLIYYHKFLS